MATRAAIAEIEANARKRVREAEEALVSLLRLTPEPPPPPARQPELAQAYELERHARVLESVVEILREA